MSDRFDRMASNAANHPNQLRAEYGELIEYILKNFKDLPPEVHPKQGRYLVREFTPRQDNSIWFFWLQYRVHGQVGAACRFGRDYNSGRYFFQESGSKYRFCNRKQDVEKLVIQNLKAYNFI